MRSINLVFFWVLLVGKGFGQIFESPLPQNINICYPTHDLKIDQKTNESRLFKKKSSSLDLPFFDDFFQSGPYPDTLLWQDNWTYINGHFAIEPPSFGVATFDFFDSKGRPYERLGTAGLFAADTLTSKKINLRDSFSKKYSLADSLVLSFFVQAKGLGFPRTAKDKLILQMKDSNNTWALVWENNTLEGGPFQYIAIPIRAGRYLHKNFQFRFINYTPAWGNSNQWHLDYILLDKNRTVKDIGFEDYAIQSTPTSLLKDYSSMPYDHFLAGGNLANDSIWFYVSNLSKTTKQFQVRHKDSAEVLQIASTNFNQNVTNCAAQSNSLRRLPMYDFSLLASPVTINRQIEMQEDGIQNENRQNDALRVQQKFRNYFAYDDGSAEASFGFNDLSTGLGKLAVQFELYKADTLRGFSIFYNQELKDLSTAQITLSVWTELDEGNENLLWEKQLVTPSYTDSLNGFHYYSLDTFFSLPKGKFFIGWTQTDNFNLHVGLDKNAGLSQFKVQENQKIWANIFGSWQKVSGLFGSPMIRPFVGSAYQPIAGSKEIAFPPLLVYPNPTQNWLYFEEALEDVRIYNLKGELVYCLYRKSNKIDLHQLPKGHYYLLAKGTKRRRVYKKIIKL
ncbi:MAG: T9SS type A sorting domain-containing protein [Bacteroidota bacterium]|nr:T9SS type A sorting domain-containing protein [Bacteroidota bacterium]